MIHGSPLSVSILPPPTPTPQKTPLNYIYLHPYFFILFLLFLTCILFFLSDCVTEFQAVEATTSNASRFPIDARELQQCKDRCEKFPTCVALDFGYVLDYDFFMLECTLYVQPAVFSYSSAQGGAHMDLENGQGVQHYVRKKLCKGKRKMFGVYNRKSVQLGQHIFASVS